MQILIVEDEEKIANFLRRGLLEEGYAVDIAGFLTFLVAGCWLLWGCYSSAVAQKLSHKMGDIGCFGGQEIAGGLLKRRFWISQPRIRTSVELEGSERALITTWYKCIIMTKGDDG